MIAGICNPQQSLYPRVISDLDRAGAGLRASRVDNGRRAGRGENDNRRRALSGAAVTRPSNGASVRKSGMKPAESKDKPGDVERHLPASRLTHQRARDVSIHMKSPAARKRCPPLPVVMPNARPQDRERRRFMPNRGMRRTPFASALIRTEPRLSCQHRPKPPRQDCREGRGSRMKRHEIPGGPLARNFDPVGVEWSAGWPNRLSLARPEPKGAARCRGRVITTSSRRRDRRLQYPERIAGWPINAASPANPPMAMRHAARNRSRASRLSIPVRGQVGGDEFETIARSTSRSPLAARFSPGPHVASHAIAALQQLMRHHPYETGASGTRTRSA